ncbi:Aminomethyltransferase [Thalassoporum mexicanum PCC 7367]|uniref:glycine cleavage system aminomethyltransferase GcvT n=1 Tax=Thalassoporum mexicanum TaxID=3457544 RepID=UPI00029FBB70|nr:glycine cleavage system aminomethyltransferase GcvT [Pseudanabaena sp. PCC 7367]AFY70421.1 Aminomethyltransferase [Pseudanabaena sp. PCC 7367]
MTNLNRTPLYDLHLAAGARMVEFGGWEMPVQYSGIIAEHQAVRSQTGVFDVSHMGKFEFRGDRILETLQKLVPSNLARLVPGRAQYTVLLNESGGIIDDVIFYCHSLTLGNEHWSVIVNASTTEKDKTWILKQLTNSSVELIDNSPTQILLAIQGATAEQSLQSLAEADLSKLKRFRHLSTEILGQKVFIARTGYTGEDGFEVLIDIETGKQLWQELLAAGVVPCGLGCRDTLRLEAGLHLYGQDMNDETTPLEADLSWLMHMNQKGDFIGRSRLEAQLKEGLPRKLVAIEMEGRNIARHDYPILINGKTVGIITSGTMSPTLGKAIALGYVPTEFTKVGQKIQVQIRNKQAEGKLVDRPFYKP